MYAAFRELWQVFELPVQWRNRCLPPFVRRNHSYLWIVYVKLKEPPTIIQKVIDNNIFLFIVLSSLSKEVVDVIVIFTIRIINSIIVRRINDTQFFRQRFKAFLLNTIVTRATQMNKSTRFEPWSETNDEMSEYCKPKRCSTESTDVRTATDVWEP